MAKRARVYRLSVRELANLQLHQSEGFVPWNEEDDPGAKKYGAALDAATDRLVGELQAGGADIRYPFQKVEVPEEIYRAERQLTRERNERSTRAFEKKYGIKIRPLGFGS